MPMTRIIIAGAERGSILFGIPLGLVVPVRGGELDTFGEQDSSHNNCF